MGSFVRQRLIAHSFRGKPCFRVLGVEPQGYGNGSSAAGYATESGQDEASSTWFQTLKGVLEGKESSETKPQGSEPVASDSKATLPGDFTMENFTDELKKARQFGSVTTVGRGLLGGGEMSVVMSLKRHEDILRALYKRDPVREGAQQKYFWRGCQGYSSLPHGDEGEAGEGIQDEIGGEGESFEGSWKRKERLFGANAAERKREQEQEVGVADVDWLKLTDLELQRQCRVETLRSSGPGGQHRNKTESAVRLLHLPTGLVAFAAEDRSQHKNRSKAFKRLREVIAIEVRRPVELEGYRAPPELKRILPSGPKASRKREGGQKIGPNHDDFVQGVQPLLDLLGATKGSISECAAILGLSTGALSRLVVSDRVLWKGVNNLRAAYNLKSLRGD
ncbi:hypothetical protein M758_2G171900 [Ceratodon purpureus]|nr:hypothetical protein M758_2G171900 [Ceratodon purpureus]